MTRPQVQSDFIDLARQLHLLEDSEAAELARRAAETGTPPGQLAQQLGQLDASQVDIVETLLNPTGTIPGYRIERLVGRGGMGVVYAARQLNLDREVALKTIVVSRMADRSTAGRFEQEAQTVGRLRHPNIIAAYDFGRQAGRLFLAMEYIDGEDAETRIQREQRLDEPTVWSLVRQAAAGLSHAAAQGIVHRDIKPANLLLVEAPEGFQLPRGVPMVKIADFGLAFLAGDERAHTRLTSQTSTVGSPHYMAPEQLTDGAVDHRADIYALGATAYHLLSGRPPCAGMTLSQIVASKLSGETTPLREIVPQISAASCCLVERMMARQPQDRFENYTDLLQAIDALERSTTSTEKIPAVGVELTGGPGVFSGRGPADVAATQTMPVSGDDTYAFETSPIRRRQPWWRPRSALAIAGCGLLLGLCVWGLLLSRRPLDERAGPRPAMISTGWSTPLFYGTTTTGWQNLSGNWVAGTDEEGSYVLAGSDGEVARPLFLREEADGRMVAPTFYRLQLFVQPNQASAVGVHFGLQPVEGRDGPRHVVRISEAGVDRGSQTSDRAPFEPSRPTAPLSVPWTARHRITLERLPDGWYMSVDDDEYPVFPLRTAGELPEIRLSVTAGPAWFSDLIIEELTPDARATAP